MAARKKSGGDPPKARAKSAPKPNSPKGATERRVQKKYGVNLPKPKPNVGKDGKPHPTAEEKVKIAKQLYRDNPSKAFADGVKRAEANLAKERSVKKK